MTASNLATERAMSGNNSWLVPTLKGGVRVANPLSSWSKSRAMSAITAIMWRTNQL